MSLCCRESQMCPECSVIGRQRWWGRGRVGSEIWTEHWPCHRQTGDKGRLFPPLVFPQRGLRFRPRQNEVIHLGVCGFGSGLAAPRPVCSDCLLLRCRGVGWSVPAMACPLRVLRRGAEPRTAKAGGVPAASLLAPSSLRTPLPDPSAKQTGPESWTGLPVPAGVQVPWLGTGSLWFSLTPGDSVARVTGHVLGLHAPQGARLPAWGWLGTVAGSEA